MVLVAIVAAGCGSSAGQADEAALCKVEPGVICRDRDMRGVSMVAADLHGADFSGSDLRGSDLRDANLADAKFVGAILGDVDFTGASLKNADLSKANLFGTNFTQADMTGTIQTGVFTCRVTLPDGAVEGGACEAAAAGATAPPGPAPTAPVIDYFRAQTPVRCLNDAAGTGLDVEWKTRGATAITFSVDGIRIESATKAKGAMRLPFVCDGKPHVVSMQAAGLVPPAATGSFTASVAATSAAYAG